MRALRFIRERWVGISSSFSGMLGFLGSYQVCHNLCLGVIALLSLIGISLAGMPFLFLTKVAIPFWTAAASLFAISTAMYVKKRCVSRNMLLFNGGIIVAGTPFDAARPFLPFFWIIGGTGILLSILLAVRERMQKRNKEKTG